jgi:3-dehydroquinate synthase
MFRELETNSLRKYQDRKVVVCKLIQRNAILKTRVVQRDEFEKGDRKLLNFGHTLGHALEKQYDLSHGQAISIGMTYACHFSERIIGFGETSRVVSILEKYGLPTYANFDKRKVFEVLKMDKKRERREINYVLLEKIGKGVIKTISLDQLARIIEAL